MSRIVVGVDSSPDAERALQWAVDEARLRQATLEVVHAYLTFEVTTFPTVVALPSDDEMKAAAQSVIAEALESLGDTHGIEIVRTAAAGGASTVLTEAAKGADLLVVGARGLGGFRGLLLGSVSQQVVTHSPCPVVVVTGER